MAVFVISLLASHNGVPEFLRAIAALTLVVAVMGKSLGWTRWAEVATLFPIVALGACVSLVLVWAVLRKKR